MYSGICIFLYPLYTPVFVPLKVFTMNERTLASYQLLSSPQSSSIFHASSFYKHWEYQGLLNVHTQGETHAVGPVQPSPPHLSHLLASGPPPLALVVVETIVVVRLEVVELRVVVEILVVVVVELVRLSVVVESVLEVEVRLLVVEVRAVLLEEEPPPGPLT